MRFRMNDTGNYNKYEWGWKQMVSEFLPTEGIKGLGLLFTYSEKESLRQWMFYDCSVALVEARAAPISTIIFYYGHKHDITSIETGFLIHWLQCFIVINGGLNTLAT